jgi:UDP-N-acetylmuramoylalanine--D-glutamate ligase
MGKINKVAVFGMGKSGKAAVLLAKMKGEEVFAVNKGDPSTWLRQDGLDQILTPCMSSSEEDFARHFAKMDEIVISPGIPVTHPALTEAVTRKIPILSEIEYAWRECSHVPVIAITGSNGKTTTTTMITEALRKAGKKVFCGGNIGIPYCDLPLSGENFDFAVIEVSSFQLETIHEFHPKVGLILNIVPNHSERYDQVADYARAKFRLLKNMTPEDSLILGTENHFLGEIATHSTPKHFFTKGDLPSDFTGKFRFQEAKVKGEHNEANFYATYKTLELLKIANLDSIFREFIRDFAGVPHRLEFVLEKNGLRVFNDAKSTNTLATSTAIKAFKDSTEPLYLILGGRLRNEEDRFLPDLLPFKNKISEIFTIGEVTERLYGELASDFKVTKAQDLTNVLQMVKGRNLSGNLVFSPAFPSFDQFKNYVDRGEKFKQWAREIL